MKRIRRLLGFLCNPYPKHPGSVWNDKSYTLILPPHEKRLRFRLSVGRPSKRRLGIWASATAMLLCLVLFMTHLLVKISRANAPHWRQYPL